LKNWPLSILIRRSPQLLAVDLAAVMLALLRGRGGAALRARCSVLSQLPRLVQARRRVQAMRKLSDDEVARLFTPGEGALSIFRRKMADR
jgi:hypothetical protein